MADQQTPEKSIFLSALEIASAAERASFLEQACAGNPALRAAVEALLQAHEKPQQLLDDPLVAAPTVDQTPELERPGTVVGPYKLLEVIGEGGMGTVYMAQQTVPVKRLVAVKLIKPGMDTRQVLARFEAERQALALMEHPNIARVLDAGATATGRPYFVMELVKGMPLTKYCDEHRLAPRERLELFIPVCQAIQHAHQKGIIHRDIKPSNVLVASFDGKPVPKVIDFGVAKAAGQQLTERTLVTGFGAVVGTLEYMSPEQAELNQIDIDTRSDIYSLGVLLYELLTGSTPLEKKRLKEAAMLEVLRLIREEEPPRPSTRLSTTEELPSIAASRNLEPKKLSGLVRGELDWIAMKALEKDRNRRYETANGLAMDVQRYLADEAVQACPPSVGYRLRKWLRRNRLVVAGTAAGLVFALVLLSGLSLWLWQQALTGRAAKADLETAEAGLREDQDPARIRLALERARARLAGSGSAILQNRLKRLERDVATADQLDEARLQRSELSSEALQGVDYTAGNRKYALAFSEYGLDVDGADPDAAAAQVRSSAIRTQLILALDDWAFCRDKLAKGSGTAPRLIAERADNDPLRQRLRTAATTLDKAVLAHLADEEKVLDQPPAHLWLLASALRDADDLAAAERLLRPAQQRHPGDFWVNVLLARIQELKKPPDRVEAVRFYQAALAVRPKSGAALLYLGNSLAEQKKLSEAEAAYRKAIELQPDSAYTYYELGVFLNKQKRPVEAEAAFRKAIELQPDYALPYNGLGNTLFRQTKPTEAEAAYRKAIELRPDLAAAYNGLGAVLRDQKMAAEAEAAFRKAIELQPDSADAYCNLGNMLREQKRLPEAEAAFRKAIEVEPGHVLAHNNLGTVLRDQNKLAEAEAAYRKAIELQPGDAEGYLNLGILRVNDNRLVEGEAAWRKAIELQPDYAHAYYLLGRLLRSQNRPEEAEAFVRKSVEVHPGDALTHYNLGVFFGEEQRWPEAQAAYRKAIEIDPKFVLAICNLALSLKGDVDEVFGVLDEALRRMPDEARLWETRAEFYMDKKKWREADADLAEASRLNPGDVGLAYRSAVAHLASRDGEGYRRTCAEMLERFGRAELPGEANGAALTCMLAPDAVADFDPLVRLQEQFVAKNAGNWSLLVNFGGILCRAGRYEESVRALDKSRAAHPNGGNGYDWYFLALAHHHLGHTEESHRWLEKAVEWHTRALRERIDDPLTTTPLRWNVQVTMEVLRREAESLILGKDEKQSESPNEMETKGIPK